MTLSDFESKAKPGDKGYILKVPGGYFSGMTMKNCHLISDISESFFIRSLASAIIWRNDILESEICSVQKKEDGMIYIRHNRKTFIF